MGGAIAPPRPPPGYATGPNQGCFSVTKFSFVKALNFMHQLSKSHLRKNAKKIGLARSKNMR